MISHLPQSRTVEIEAKVRRGPSRFEIAWRVAAEGLANAPESVRRAIFAEGSPSRFLRVLLSYQLETSARVVLQADGAGRPGVEVARFDWCDVSHDEAGGMVHIDSADRQGLRVTLRTCSDAPTLVYARSNVFETLGVPGGRVEPPALLSAE